MTVANRADLDLARRLLGDRVVSEDRIREALKIQADYLEKGRSVTLEQVLYARGDVPKGSLCAAWILPESGRIDPGRGRGGLRH